MSIINNGLLLAAEAAAAPVTGISRSLRFNAPDSAYLSRTPGTAGNRKTWTWAGWVKRSKLSELQQLFGAGQQTSNDGVYSWLRIDANDKLNFRQWTDGGSLSSQLTSTAVFRDTSAWFHLVFAYDSTQASDANKVKIYINGVQITVFDSADYPGLNDDAQINNTKLHTIGSANDGGSQLSLFNGYLADIHFIDGQALDPSSFGEFDTNGVWQPIEYAGSYGTNGFRLPFSDNSGTSSTTLGKDAAGSNNWTPNNFSVAAGAGNDSLVDSPTNYGTDTGAGGEVRGNYCTLNPLQNGGTLANGNLDYANLAANNKATYGTIGVSSGKWYFEVVLDNVGNKDCFAGIAKASGVDTGSYIGSTADSWGYISTTGSKYNNGSGSAYGASYTNGDVVGVALDVDAGTLVFYKNGSSQGTAFSGLTAGTYFPAVSCYNSSLVANFGQRPFAYTAPSGFKALCTTNLPEPTIADGSTAMDVALYTGNGSTQTISGLGFSPDFVWLKKRSGVADHYLYDTIRGATYRLYSNTTDAESTSATALTAFTSTGFELGSANDVNQSSNTYVAWTWDAGSSTVTNTQGSITSQVRANASAGFSVVSWTSTSSSATIGHSLGVEPYLIITKGRSGADNWVTYHKSAGATKYLYLNATDAATTYSGFWNDTAPTSAVFTTGTDAIFTTNGRTKIAYCFAPVAGYSSFGSYTGNGSADGPFVYTGFRPRWIMVKCVDSAQNWFMLDTARNTYNAVNSYLMANSSSAEDANNSTVNTDFASNGFKVRATTSNLNNNAQNYVFAAFAESPFQYARAR